MALVRRLLKLGGEVDSALVARLVGRLVPDPNLRGFAAISPLIPDADAHVLSHALERSRVLLLRGPAGFALVGDAFALYSAARELAALARPGVSSLGAWLVAACEAVDGVPAALGLGSRRLEFARPQVMGVVNVTPDSFSDGGAFVAPDAAIAHGMKLVDEGADLLDIGGESTRPRGTAYGEGAATVAIDEELARVVPVIRGLRARTDVPISIDTRNAAVAAAAIEAGATLVNDVTGLKHDPSLADVVARTHAALCLMHVPVDIEALGHETPTDDVLGDVLAGLSTSIEQAISKGIPRERLLVDPGLGFGKTKAANLFLMRHVPSLAAFGLPVVIGASRKSTLGAAAGGWWSGGPSGSSLPVGERLFASVGAAVAAVLSGAHVIRVHDVRATVEALRVAHAVRAADPDNDH